MTDEMQYRKAILIASKAHAGQKDRGGNEYVDHLAFVADHCSSLKAKIVGWLHDIIEDTDYTGGDLLALGFSKDIVDAVVLLTKDYGEGFDYYEYLLAIKDNPLACEVKKADLINNMDLSRISSVTGRDLLYREKYKISLSFLEGRLEDDYVFPAEWSVSGMHL